MRCTLRSMGLVATGLGLALGCLAISLRPAAAAPAAGAAAKAEGGAAAATAGEWPCWRGPNHDGKSTETGLLKEWPAGGPEQLWKVSGIGSGFSSVTVSGGMVYITGEPGGQLVLSAYDLDGKSKWQVQIDKAGQLDHPGSRGSPVVDGGKVYVLSGNGLLACVDARKGTGVWSANLRTMGGQAGGWGYAESPLISGANVIVKPGGKSCIVALNKLTGKPVWASTGVNAAAEYSSCTPFTFSGVPLIVTGTSAGLVCVSAKTGAVAWTNGFAAHNVANCPTPAYADGYVFWANGYNKGGVCVKLKKAASGVGADQAWATRDMECHHGGFIIHEGYVYGNNGGGWACLDLKTGKRQWNEGGVGKGSLIWADDMLYLFSEGGGKAGLATCSPEGMKMKGTFSVKGQRESWAHPVIAGARLYLRYDDNLYCFDIKAK
jgi:outer membrane protein assembly factor BamB